MSRLERRRAWLGRVPVLGRIAASGPVLPLLLGAVMAVTVSVDMSAFRVLFPEMHAGLGVSTGVLTALATVPMLIAACFAPAVGFVADRVKRVKLQAFVAIVANTAIVATGLAPTVAWLVGARVVQAGAALAQSPLMASLYTDYYPPQTRGRVFALSGLSSSVGMTVGPVLAGVIASRVGWRMTMVLIGGVALVAGLSFFLLREPQRGHSDRLALGDVVGAAADRPKPPGWLDSWRLVWRIRTMRRFAYAMPLLSGALNVIAILIILHYSEHFHLSPAQLGLVVTTAMSPALLGSLIGGPIIDRLMARRPGGIMILMGGVVLLHAAALLFIVNTENLAGAVAVNGLLTFSSSLLLPAMSTTMSMVLPARVRGFGLQSVAPFLVVGLVLYVVLGALAQSAGVAAAVMACIPIIVVSAIIFVTGAGGVDGDIRAAAEENLRVHAELHSQGA